jgi:hypothetical protein
LNFADNGVTFLGPISFEQLRVLYQGSEALVFPSLYEGFGLPPLEAMAAGAAVIAMPISSVPEVADDCVLYPDGFSAEALARAMELLAGNAELRARLRSSGLKHVSRFSWQRTARQTVEVYRSAVFRPSECSLAMRRSLREAILNWADTVVNRPGLSSVIAPPKGVGGFPEASGIRTAWRDLQGAVSRRLSREMKRFFPASSRRTA